MYKNIEHLDTKEGRLEVSERIRELREAKGLTQDELAEALGYHNRQTVTKWETGTLPTVNALKKLCVFFNKSSEYILGLTRYSHVENEQISELTGLSDESIEVLRAIKKHTTDILGEDGTPDVKMSKLEKRTTDYINFELGLTYKDWKENGDINYIHSIFATMFEYVSTEKNSFFHKVIGGKEEVSSVYVTDNERDFIVLDVNELYRTNRLQKVTEELTNRKNIYKETGV